MPVSSTAPSWKCQAASQVLDQLARLPAQLARMRLPRKGYRPLALNLQVDAGRRPRLIDKPQDDAGTQGTRARVNLGLRQIERVLAFDVAAAHVVAGGYADDFEGGVDDQRQLRLRHIPGGVAANAHRRVRRDNPGTARFEEELGPRRRVDAGIDVAAVQRLFLACGAAAFVGDAGRPHVLVVHRRQQRQPIGRARAVEVCDRIGVAAGSGRIHQILDGGSDAAGAGAQPGRHRRIAVGDIVDRVVHLHAQIRLIGPQAEAKQSNARHASLQ